MELNIIDFENRLKNRKNNQDNFLLLDVRNPTEQDICTIPGTDILIPVKDVPNHLDLLKEYSENDIIVYCRIGVRSLNVCEYLKTQGFTKVLNLTGGILEYIDKVDNSLPVY